MRVDEIEWRNQGNSVQVGMTWHGQGELVLMLPALSSISTRSEMWPLQECLIVLHDVGHRLGGIW